MAGVDGVGEMVLSGVANVRQDFETRKSRREICVLVAGPRESAA